VLAACCVLVAVHLQPDLVLRNTTPNGGDLGAHVWWPAYLRDHLLPWRLAGWSPDFYAGFPAGQFYFPIPALAIVGLDLVVPYNVAFKLVVVLGPVLVPAGAYVFAKGLRAPNPTPAAFAVAMTSLLFFTGAPGTVSAAETIAFNQRIMGGNLASTLAGEFSFTLALALALFFLGTLAMAVRGGRRNWLPAVLLALCLMSHLMVGILAGVGAVAVWVFHSPVRNFRRAAAVGGVGALLAGVWLVPLLVTMRYTTDMRYGPIGVAAPPDQEFADYLFPSYFFHPNGWWPYDWGAFALIGIALMGAVVMLRRSTLVVLVMAAACGLLFRFWTDLGTHVWNLRLLPFWYIGVHLLVAIGLAELVRALGWAVGRGWRAVAQADDDPTESIAPLDGEPAAEAGSTTPATTPVPSPPPTPPPPPPPPPPPTGARVGAGLTVLALTAALATGALVTIDDSKAFLPYWAKWNFSGYENREDEITGTYRAPCASSGSVEQSIVSPDAAPTLCEYENKVALAKQWPEYRALMDELERLRPGRLLWEGGSSLDKYGTPLSLMLVPYWTKGRISSMEGVYFEASATTPYHFETVAALVAPGEASNPVRGIPYRDQQSFDIGVRSLQTLGVDYFIAHKAVTKEKADADARLRLLGTSPDLDGADPLGWSIYRVTRSPMVQALGYEPVVAEGVAPDPDGWEQQVAVPWFWFPEQHDKPVVADGLASWRRADGGEALITPRRSVRPARVRDVEVDDDSIRFRVDRVGRPVLVKVSYFPNWTADGAEGPFRATPNFMVVVPTEREVTLRYGTTTAEWLGRLCTLVGVLAVAGMVRNGRRTRRSPSDVPPSAGPGPSDR
jgi:hypothetical protein